MAYSIERFNFSKHSARWNEFVGNAKNSTFLFNRGFMDYHRDRFTDHSLIVLNEKNNIIACFPAHELSGEIHSHKGLTYGSFILDKEQKLPVTIRVYKATLKYYHEQGFDRLVYKAFPRLYNNLQTDEIEYCLFLSNARLFRRDTSIALDRQNRIKYAGNIKREAHKANSEGVMVKEEASLGEFWTQVLVPNLENRFGVRPVHSLEEITILKEKFPENIRLFTARSAGNELIAGTVLFIMNNVVHCQYISANSDGRNSGALNLLFTTLLDEYFLMHRFFDFGTANEQEGRSINVGLLSWKERMGGRAYAHDFYQIDTAAYVNLPEQF